MCSNLLSHEEYQHQLNIKGWWASVEDTLLQDQVLKLQISLHGKGVSSEVRET